ncbi:hypothetical protein [Azospirillum rugosum]|uniref:Uncharacterized protein n=1 Tax=Azospirillum rugosum TaxID=416170 RepID=A0ABS4SEL8_9PROT|nr:hypothetical protein [Azospirillum rugosum]MBP2291031.1 hypothetical protein [Azospirillum rugosum]MDQ0524905.1 hypothetical protein [Azospirillum rugosum]
MNLSDRSTRVAACRLFLRKLEALGLPRWYAVACTRESLAYAKHTAVGRTLGVKLFQLRRAEYCAVRFRARWGLAMGQHAAP